LGHFQLWVPNCKAKRAVELTAVAVLNAHNAEDQPPLSHLGLPIEKSDVLSNNERLLPFSFQTKCQFFHIFCTALNAH